MRVARECECDAVDGTEAMETVSHGMCLYNCHAVLHPGDLAAACVHDSWMDSDPSRTEPGVPRLWLFCPDPLCLMSKPYGSDLPPW